MRIIKKLLIITLLIITTLFTITFADVDTQHKYTHEELNYFYKVALGSEYGNSTQVIRKWETDEITIGIRGNPLQEHIDEVNKIINELTIMTNIKFTIVNDSADININFIEHKDFKKYVSPQVANSNWGCFYVWWNNNRIYKGKIYIAIDKGTIESQKHLIREELTQSLGLMNDTYDNKGSIFYEGWEIGNEYLNIDKVLIKLLYEDYIQIGMDRKQIEEVITNTKE